ncbi:MAG: NADP-dependent oxidoreductase [Pseudomonadota bacterium]
MVHGPEATQIRMMDYPGTGPARDVWKVTNDDTPALETGQVLVRIDWVSVDPGMSGWITNKRSYMPPVMPGGVMRAFGVGEVIESRANSLKQGEWVTGFLGLQSKAVFTADNPAPFEELRKIPVDFAPPNLFLSGLGMTGYTAYFGMMDIGRPKPGETVVVSAASGAVGSVAAQLAKNSGARVIGVAGGQEKCGYLIDELGLDGAIDYKAGDIRGQLKSLTPDRVDVYFDNVGGDILDELFLRMKYRGRIVVCGGISQYNSQSRGQGQIKGPSNYLTMVAQSLTMRGFTMKDYMDRVPEALPLLAKAWSEGQLKFREHVVEGIEKFPDTFEMLFDGRNHGKLLIKVQHAS